MKHFKFLDESSINIDLTRLYGRAAPGQRVERRRGGARMSLDRSFLRPWRLPPNRVSRFYRGGALLELRGRERLRNATMRQIERDLDLEEARIRA